MNGRVRAAYDEFRARLHAAQVAAQALKAGEAVLPEFADAGGSLVAMTPDTGGRALTMKRASGLNYQVLSDVDLETAMAFGIVFRAPPLYAGLLRRAGVDLAAWFLPIPATFLVRGDGVIARAWVNIDFAERAEPLDAVRALRAL